MGMNFTELISGISPYNYRTFATSPVFLGFPDGSAGKKSTCKAGDAPEMDSVPESVRSPGGGKWQATPYFYLENPIDRGAWGAIVHGVAKSWTLPSD